jgi:hypothetical protein
MSLVEAGGVMGKMHQESAIFDVEYELASSFW